MIYNQKEIDQTIHSSVDGIVSAVGWLVDQSIEIFDAIPSDVDNSTPNEQFDAVDLSTPILLTKELTDYLKYARGYEDRRLVDCSDLADDLNSIGEGGQILELTPINGKTFRGIEYDEVTDFYYHQVYEQDGYIYDPMFSDKAIPKDEFF